MATALLLTWIAGFVDAVGFLAFAHIYTANMSGNSVAIGIDLSKGQWPQFALRLWPVVMYVAGLLLGRALIEFGAVRGIQRIASIAFACEVLLLGFVSSGITSGLYAAIALLAGAMGIQNATLTKFSSLTLNTGFVTGTLVKFSEQVVAYGMVLFRTIRSGRPAADPLRHKSFRMSLFLGLSWLAYVAGAAAGAWGKILAGTIALVVPIMGLASLTIVDVLRPLAIQEEEQARTV